MKKLSSPPTIKIWDPDKKVWLLEGKPLLCGVLIKDQSLGGPNDGIGKHCSNGFPASTVWIYAASLDLPFEDALRDPQLATLYSRPYCERCCCAGCIPIDIKMMTEVTHAVAKLRYEEKQQEAMDQAQKIINAKLKEDTRIIMESAIYITVPQG